MASIYSYIAQESNGLAEGFVSDLEQKIRWIAEVDFTGVPRDDLSASLRAHMYKKRCIYFRSYDDRIEIIRVLHSAQDQMSAFAPNR